MALLLHLFLLGCFAVAQASNFYNDFFVSWGDGRGNILNNGQMLTLSLDKIMGSGFQSKNEYLFSKIDMNIKLVPGNSAGTVTTFYMSSSGPNHDEIDFEFLGNSSGDPYTLHTNVYSQGKGNKEQQFRLWFDPTANFHVYSILWNPHLILFYVDGTPIRVFKNMESIGLPYLNGQKMNIYATLWDAEDWATQGGRVKTDWSKAPFIATYGSYVIQGANSSNSSRWMNQQLNSRIQHRINSVRAKHLIYDYCYDQKRFPGGEPVECRNTSS